MGVILKTAKPFFTNKKVLLVLVFSLLALNLTLMGVSLAKYTSEVNLNRSVKGIISFSIKDDTVFEEEVTIGAPSGSTGEEDAPALNQTKPVSMEITNDGDHAAVGTVTVEYENVLPLDYLICINDNEIQPTSAENNVYTYEVKMTPGEVLTLDLLVKWQDGAYDERLGGLTETAHFRAVFEQDMGGA